MAVIGDEADWADANISNLRADGSDDHLGVGVRAGPRRDLRSEELRRLGIQFGFHTLDEPYGKYRHERFELVS